jgi:hypothetical protein
LDVLVFAKGAFPAELEQKPNEVDVDELREAVSKYREIDDIRPGRHPCQCPANARVAHLRAAARDGRPGPGEVPGYLLTAHKAG